MRFDLITIFPEFFGGPLDFGIVRRAREAKLIDIAIHDLRNFTHDRHRTVDDRQLGGGEGNRGCRAFRREGDSRCRPCRARRPRPRSQPDTGRYR